ncbi:MAG TPA: cyclase family protein [Stellaceae bacterium]|nr:cyclase family protein [Stellaceae bacterium]
MTENPRWKRRPPGSTWGDWGPDDQLGRLNLLTPKKVLEGVAEVKEGLSFCLSLPLDYPGGSKLNPRRNPPELRPTVRGGLPNFNYPVGRENAKFTDIICDDVVLLTLQYSTQWDSLAHVGQQFDVDGSGKPAMVYYNGYRANEHVVGPFDHVTGKENKGHVGARRLGVENMAAKAIQGRAVMIDLEAHYGHERKLVSFDELSQIMRQDKVEVEEGDMVCIRTGFAQRLLDMKKEPDEKVLHGSCAVLDGRDERLLNWITKSGLVSLIADNYAVEASPSRECEEDHCAALPLHAHCLFKLGVNLGEIWYLSELADWLRAHKRNRFLLTAPPLRLPGAVGSPATPVGTV